MKRICKEGVILYNVTDYQAAVTLGLMEFEERTGHPADIIALPNTVDPAGLDLPLPVADHPSSPGTVFVGVSK